MYESAVARELANQVQNAIQRVSEELNVGWTVKDFTDYRYKVGQIEALKAVLEYIGEAKTNAMKR